MCWCADGTCLVCCALIECVRRSGWVTRGEGVNRHCTASILTAPYHFRRMCGESGSLFLISHTIVLLWTKHFTLEIRKRFCSLVVRVLMRVNISILLQLQSPPLVRSIPVCFVAFPKLVWLGRTRINISIPKQRIDTPLVNTQLPSAHQFVNPSTQTDCADAMHRPATKFLAQWCEKKLAFFCCV